VVSLGLYNEGRTSAEPILLDFARQQGSSPGEFMLPVPSWLHPAWLICAGFLTMGLLGVADFPTSAVPVMALVGAVLIDVAVTFRVPALIAGPVVALATYGAAWVQDIVWVIPPWSWWSAIWVSLALAVLWCGVERYQGTRRARAPFPDSVAQGDDPVSTDPADAPLPRSMI